MNISEIYLVRVCVLPGHSMAETLTVALRVAEEAIEEAITKAEEFRDSLVRYQSLSSPSPCLYIVIFKFPFFLIILISFIPIFPVMAPPSSSSVASLLVSVSAGCSHGLWLRCVYKTSPGSSVALNTIHVCVCVCVCV